MPSTHAFFIAGTDTGVGKTFVTTLLLRAARLGGYRTLGMKPVAAGVDAHGRNDDVEALMAASNCSVSRSDVNPFLYRAAVSPHIAARDEGRPIDLGVIVAAQKRLAAQAEILLVEGVGGFRAPLSECIDSADLACALQLPVVLGVGLRLGCLSHALLTAEAIAARGLTLAGWVANHMDPGMACPADNVQYLQTHLQQVFACPFLGQVPCIDATDASHSDRLDAVAQALHLPWPRA